MSQAIKLFLAGLCLVMVGCSQNDGVGSPPPPSPAPPPPAAPAPAPLPLPPPVMDFPDRAEGEPAFDDAVSLEIVTDFLSSDRDFKPNKGELPIGLVLFDRGEELKNAVICDAYTKELRTYSDAVIDSPDQDFFVTYWLLKDQPADFSSCDALRQSYDYDRAAAIKAEYGLSDTAGPVFLAVDSDGNSVFLDLSAASLEATRSAVDQWLVLALEASAEAEVQEAMVDDEPMESVNADGDATTPMVSSRFSLASFSTGMKAKFLTDGNSTVSETKKGNTTLFAYSDSGTGYRIGSTLRF
ncbi:hypothetical protein [Hirschia litorea]|uniref:Uncharacterized protein n=1 Tax=Hirschia litorea TaxID=1199156 RepID=A0ABW2IMW0_9PROT